MLMPEGRVIAVLFDNILQEYVAISRPVEISSGATTYVWPKPPREGSDLLVALTRPSGISRKSDHDVGLLIRGIEGGPRGPEIVVSTRDRIYGFWYGLHGGAYATLEVKSETVFLSPQDVVLRKRKVESYSGVLRPLPTVEVEISLPNEMKPTAMALEVLTAAEMRSIRRVELPPDTGVYNFEALPTEAVYVKLETPPWAYYEWLDLGTGGDHKALFQPNPIHVTGTVYRGTVEHSASLTFRTNRMSHEDELIVETDEQGHYEVILFRPGEYVVLVRLEGGKSPAFFDYPQIAEKFSVVVDFQVPPNRYWVNVIDSETRDGIAGAEVYADSTFAEGQRGESSLSITDDKGIAELPPFRRGEVAVSAKAKGYLPSEWTRELVNESALERELTLELRPIGATAPLRLLLSDGAPAVNAEVRAQAALDNTLPFWEGRCDQTGVVNIPDYADGAYILVRHPDAGSTIRRWRRSEASGEYLEWSLASPAPPLSVNVSRAWGDPVGASLALWLFDLRVTGRTLAWLAGSPVGGTNSQGKWQAHNLPPTPISVLAWTHSVTGGALAGAYDSFAVPVPFPWPEIVQIETAD
ncbi:MAG: hypothetical protein GY835_03875 [bacterium]|nr:hypothetical protein [bacterium]